MNWDLILLIVFYLFLLIIFKIYRNKFEIQWKVFALYKTKLGINLMDKIAKKFPKTLNFLGYFSVFIGFLGMIITFALIAFATYKFLFVPASEVALAPILPGVSISDKLPILSFWHWIISILIVAGVHEFSHGVYARLSKIRIKSSGFAFLGPILAAFVEPDEKQLTKAKTKDQLFVLSAGPFSNIILGILAILVLIFIFIPIAGSMTEINGLTILNINESLPINNSGLKVGYIIEEVDDVKIDDNYLLSMLLENKKPNDILNVGVNGSNYNVTLAENPNNKSKAFLGVALSPNVILKENLQHFSWLYKIFSWIGILLFWLFNISIGVGLFNLLPLGPVDGGRMFYVAMIKLTKNKNIAMKLLNYFSIFVLAMILINLFPFIIRLFKFILSPFF